MRCDSDVLALRALQRASFNPPAVFSTLPAALSADPDLSPFTLDETIYRKCAARPVMAER
jgi:hypothetical protein